MEDNPLIIGCNYHVKWASNKSMRFVLVAINGEIATLCTRNSYKKFNTKVSDLIFIHSAHNNQKAKEILSGQKKVENILDNINILKTQTL